FSRPLTFIGCSVVCELHECCHHPGGGHFKDRSVIVCSALAGRSVKVAIFAQHQSGLKVPPDGGIQIRQLCQRCHGSSRCHLKNRAIRCRCRSVKVTVRALHKLAHWICSRVGRVVRIERQQRCQHPGRRHFKECSEAGRYCSTRIGGAVEIAIGAL